MHIEADLRAALDWCATRKVTPLLAGWVQLGLYVRWMQEIRKFKPSTVSRPMSVVTGFDRTCVIDGVLEHPRPSTSAARACRRNHPPSA